jgi:hypothetical protein
MDRIAIAVGADIKLADFFSITEILIYEKQDKWMVVDQFEANPQWDAVSTAFVRMKAENIGNEIRKRNCNSLVAKEIIGIPYHILCKTGLEVLEADDISDKLFDEIYEDFLMKKEDNPQVIEMTPPNPIPVDDEGNYYLDFIKAIKSHPELSSKKMLIPFLTNDLFFSLRIRCEHIMPWLDDFIKIHGLRMDPEHEDGVYDVLITHKSCN